MKNLSDELKDVIGRRLTAARPKEVMAIASALCALDTPQEDLVERALAGDDVASPARRFEAIEGGTGADQVRDQTSGLIWTRGALPCGRMKWEKAKQACDAYQLGGHTWRIPTIRELLTLVDYERYSPAIDPVFECESECYWTGTVAASSPSGCAWSAYFDGGGAHYDHQSYEFFVRAVRAGQ